MHQNGNASYKTTKKLKFCNKKNFFDSSYCSIYFFFTLLTIILKITNSTQCLVFSSHFISNVLKMDSLKGSHTMLLIGINCICWAACYQSHYILSSRKGCKNWNSLGSFKDTQGVPKGG